MSEGHVYLCEWRKTGKAFEVWIEKRPRLRAKDDSLEGALRSLGRTVCLRLGDGEPYFELTPPVDPRQKGSYLALSYNSSWSIPVTFTRADYASLYEGGFCHTCCSGIGPRTTTPIPVATVASGDLLGSNLRLPPAMLASEKFRELLTEEEQSYIDWRPIEVRGKQVRKYFEVIAKNPVAAVAVRRERTSGWRCPDCRKRVFSVSGDYENTYVAASDLPAKPPPVVLIDNSHLLQPAVPWTRWQQIRGKAGAKGIVTRSVILLAPSSVCRRPRLRALSSVDSAAVNRELNISIDPSIYWPSRKRIASK